MRAQRIQGAENQGAASAAGVGGLPALRVVVSRWCGCERRGWVRKR